MDDNLFIEYINSPLATSRKYRAESIRALAPDMKLEL